jgi:hypothetical protein
METWAALCRHCEFHDITGFELCPGVTGDGDPVVGDPHGGVERQPAADRRWIVPGHFGSIIALIPRIELDVAPVLTRGAPIGTQPP